MYVFSQNLLDVYTSCRCWTRCASSAVRRAAQIRVVERQLTHTVLASRTLCGMIEVNEQAMDALDGTIAAQQGRVYVKGGLVRSSMAEGLAAECGEFDVLLGRTHEKLESALNISD